MHKQAMPLCRMAVLSVNWATASAQSSPLSSIWLAFILSNNFATHYSEGGSLKFRYEHGLPKIKVPMPSRMESRQFTLKPLSHSVADFTKFILQEDRGVDRVAFYIQDGTRIANSSSILSLLRDDFELVINDKVYTVRVPEPVDTTLESMDRINEVRNLVTQLHIDLNVDDHEIRREKSLEKELKQKLRTLLSELEPLEQERVNLSMNASRRTRRVAWGLLAWLSFKLGMSSRLIWWDYSWDIMDPVTHYFGTGTGILFFAYYVLTKQEFKYAQVYDRVYLKHFYKEANKETFDVNRYNQLRDSIAVVENDLARLQDPLLLKLSLRQSSLLKAVLQHPADLRRDPYENTTIPK